jgi:hypothetical protein
VKSLQRHIANMQVARMRRIEGAPEQTDPQSGRNRAQWFEPM